MERYVIHVTKECNCDCVYCYEQDKTSTYTWDEVKKIIDDIVRFRTEDEFGIEFLGGEPMLAWDLIKKSYEYLESMSDVKVSDYALTTNGTVMTEDIAKYLSNNRKLSFSASIDGHTYSNQLRVFKESRKNTHDKVMENIELLREHGVEASIHITAHLYNVAFLESSIDHLYRNGIRSIAVGTIETTMIIDEAYCQRFVSELDKVSKKIIDGVYPDLFISQFEWVKPYDDVRSYISDENGKVIAESYGRSGQDITHADGYNVIRYTDKDEIAQMIYNIRKQVYDLHQDRLRGQVANDN